MLPLVADENFNNNIMRGLLRQKAYLDLVRIQDMGLAHADDPTILAWAAQPGRVLLTHDVSTITKYAYERIEAGQAMPNEGQEPPHIHIKADRDQAKFWLEPIALASNYGCFRLTKTGSCNGY